MDARKRCSKCGTDKPRDEFHNNRSKRDGLHDYCKPCQRSQVKGYQARHGKHVLNRAYRYGLSQEEVRVFLQVPCCQSCGSAFGDSGEQCFDHCHERNHVRGVICQACNTACRGTSAAAIARLSACVNYLLRDEERLREQV